MDFLTPLHLRRRKRRRLRWQSRHEGLPHTFVRRVKVEGSSGCENGRNVAVEPLVSDFCGEISFELRAGNDLAIMLHVARETGDHRIGVESRQADQRFVEIEEIASLFPLVQCPQLGAEKLFEQVGEHVRGATEPWAVHLESHVLLAEHTEVLPRVDFNLQLQRRGGSGF